MTANGEENGSQDVHPILQAFAIDQTQEASAFATRAREDAIKNNASNRLYIKAKTAWWGLYALCMLAGAFALAALGFRLLGIHF